MSSAEAHRGRSRRRGRPPPGRGATSLADGLAGVPRLSSRRSLTAVAAGALIVAASMVALAAHDHAALPAGLDRAGGPTTH